MSRAAKLEQQVLARERGDVREVAAHANARLPVARCASRSGSCVATRNVARAAPRRELAVEQLGALVVEAGERLVEEHELRLVQQHAAEREPLQHPARERARALVARVPETEPLEQHADPLAPLGHAIEPPVQVEVLERGQLAVDERLVREEAELRARSRRPRARPRSAATSPATSRSSVVLPEPFGPVTRTNPPRSTSSSSPSKIRFDAVPHRKPARADHDATSSEDEEEEDEADHAVHREERRVQPPQVARTRRARARRRAAPRRRRRRASTRRRARARSRRARAERPSSACIKRAPQNAPRTPKRVAAECSPSRRSTSTSNSE